MGNVARNIIAILALAAALVTAGIYVYLHTGSEKIKRAGDVYDYRKDKALVQTVRTALSMEAVMTRLTTPNRGGVTPEVKYGLDSVSKVGPDMVEVRYRLYIQTSHETKQKAGRKRFRRKKDGTWAAVRD